MVRALSRRDAHRPLGESVRVFVPQRGGPKPYQIVSLGADGVLGGVDDAVDTYLWEVLNPSPIPSSVGWAEVFVGLWDILPLLLVPLFLLVLVIKIILGLVLFVQRLVGWGPDGTLQAPPAPVA